MLTAVWLRYDEWGRGGNPPAKERLRVLPAVDGPDPGRTRHLLALLPAAYEAADGRFPVVYLQDGQNLFDEATSHAGAWNVAAVAEALEVEGIPAIFVGIPNAAADRIGEYSPFVDLRHGGGNGEAYLRFLTEVVKPRVDADLRTIPAPERTVIGGSSLGGLISLYARLVRPDVFGLAAVLSPSLRFGGEGIFLLARTTPRAPGRFYLDAGTREASHTGGGRLATAIRSRRYLRAVRRMASILEAAGYRRGRDLRVVEARGDRHHESAWGRRLAGALRFLLR